VGSANTDKIADFKHNTDKIALEDWVFWSIGPKLEKAQFYAKAGATKAHDADDRIVYNKTNGNLYYDADGKGGVAPVLFATLSSKPTLDHGDFIIA
jgi:Ca2+-binding RTX toxin-like protein